MKKWNAFYKNYYIMLQESFSFLLALEFMITAAALTPQWFLCLAIVPMAYIIYRGKMFKLPYSQYIGTMLYLLILAEIYRSFSYAHSFLFVKQTLPGKVAMIEAFALLWIYQFYLEKINGAEILRYLGKKLRILFYLLIPLTFLQHIRIYYPRFLPLALWASCITAYLLQKLIKEEILRGEFLLLALIAALISIGVPLTLSDPKIVSPASAAVLAGVLFLGFLLWYERAFNRPGYAKNPLKILFAASWIYFAASVFLVVYSLSRNLQIAVIASGFFFIWLIRYQPLFPSVRPLWRLFYQTGKLSIMLAIILLTQSTISLTHYSLTRSIISLVGIGCLVFMIYFKPHVYRLLRNHSQQRRPATRNGDLWAVHILILIVCINTLLIMNNTLAQPLISIFILLHAIFLLFHARYESYHSLFKLALLLFGGVIIKVILYDMVGFTVFQKIIAFMIMAAILLGTAYVLQQQNVLQLHKPVRISKTPT
ncbi:MAG: hypothetical protein ACMUJM_14975 [bacterium]